MKFNNWEQKGNFNTVFTELLAIYYCSNHSRFKKK